MPKIAQERDVGWIYHIGADASIEGSANSSTRFEQIGFVGANVELAYSSSACRHIGIGGDIGTYAAPEGRGFSGSQALTVCSPTPAYPVEVTLSYERELRPRLAAAPYFLPSRFDSLGLEVQLPWVGLQYHWGQQRFMNARLRTHVFNQGIEGQNIETFELDFDVRAWGFVWPERGFMNEDTELDIIRIQVRDRYSYPASRGLSAGGVNVTSIAVVGVSGLALGERYYVDGDIGFASALTSEVMTSDGTQVDLDVLSPVLRLGVRGTNDRFLYGGMLQRSVQPTAYRAVLVEDRLSGWLQLGLDDDTVFRGFVARTDIIGESAGVDYIGGVSAERTITSNKHTRLRVRAEMARTFYATMNDGPGLNPAWIGRVSAELAAFAGNR